MLPNQWRILFPLYEAAHPRLIESVWTHRALPAAFDGLRLCYLSDMHYGPFMPPARMRELVQRVNGLHADVVVLGGDYGSCGEDSFRFFEDMPPIAAREAVLGVMGNHDRLQTEGRDARLDDRMRASGVTPVINGAYMLARGEARMAFASVEDNLYGAPDYHAARDAARGADITIFCPHSPDVLPECYFLDGQPPWFQLALCGHTHGGQFVLFGRGMVSSSRYGERFRSGWKHEYGVDIMISNGVGATFAPLRIGAPPQLHLITMRRP